MSQGSSTYSSEVFGEWPEKPPVNQTLGVRTYSHNHVTLPLLSIQKPRTVTVTEDGTFLVREGDGFGSGRTLEEALADLRRFEREAA